ncbi:replicative DNA helicase [Paraburkholderia caballeronis]|uniref:Replicative DNA helicase n=1 Tax=Paraburkholderia caballeronis TaxID=416943 RepID=A0A1H7TYZ3_9BURK|nr:replicative DNA helicase [Paraburkholderia caballeronis]PXW23389.1 replicative DNA helicase [Paraburkholderia caballeronis]PXW98382.1 replicative DNA helicase [Paraburkholderia caballeronis]RAJ95113.1 replicative DNA helicase [Paraburkholderia caballeronis]SEC56391.1 replicative DNA helicase [Paraburkholderia caballeronis]SEL89646.1 replicative DNA helicase [Paraburkholderia caballeronis]
MNVPETFDENNLRVPPHSIEMEQSVLGALMLDNEAIDRIGELRAEHFYRYEHRIIFEALAKLIMSNRAADVMTVHEALSSSGRLDQTGGLKYLNSITGNTPGAANINRYAQIVVDRAKLRQLISAADEVQTEVFHRNGKTAEELITFAQEKFEPLSEGRAEGPRFIGQFLTPVIERIDQEYHGEAPQAISTGLRDLDFKLGGGINGGDLIILAGRPSMGKTALAMAIGEHVAETHGPACAFSLEMPGAQLTQRALARQGDMALQMLRNGSRMSDSEWPKLTHATQVLSEMNLLIDDTPGLSLVEIASRSRAVKRKHGLKLIIVDYLQLMTGGPNERHDLRIGSYSAGLKELAKRLDVPVIALSQLNRGLEQRPNKRPMMSDLRDSGAIEQDADTIIFLYRDEVYHENSPDKGVAEAIIGKQRNGALGTAYMTFIHEQAKFADLAMGYVPTPRTAPTKARGFSDD